eukprot:2994110-Heterocapsa_arctica.AAC.1
MGKWRRKHSKSPTLRLLETKGQGENLVIAADAATAGAIPSVLDTDARLGPRSPSPEIVSRPRRALIRYR